jgi:hypothetical protein
MSYLASNGITIYLENAGRLERAQQMAGHESPRTSKHGGYVHDTVTHFMGLIVIAMRVQFALSGMR